MKRLIFILCLLTWCNRAFLYGQVDSSARPGGHNRFSGDSTTISNSSVVTDSLKIISLPAQDSSRITQRAPPKDSTVIRNTFVKDSTERARVAKRKLYSRPRRASILSMACPGLGQIYNKKYWKLPIIYGGIGVFAYIFATNNTQYNYYRKNLKAFYDNDSNTVNTSGYSGDQLETLKVQYRKSRDLGIIGMSLLYIFQIIDANVDGHLKTFDVSDDLSLHIEPWQNVYRTGGLGIRTATGLSLKLNFK